MNFINDIYRFITYLSFVDIVFFAAIIALLILIVTLIYFIRINRDDIEIKPNDSNKDDYHNNNKIDNPSDNHKEEEVMETKKDNLKDIVDSLEIKRDISVLDDDDEGELIDLKTLTKKLQAEKESDAISINEYEKDQEEKAIISYDELVKHQNNYSINYEKEIKDDDVIIKKVNLNDLVNKNEIDKVKEVRVISYEKEEAFLSALKELNQLLNQGEYDEVLY